MPASDDLPLRGKTILILEDEFFIAIDLERILASLGAAVVGPVSDIAAATARAADTALDGAILDVRLDGHNSEDLIRRFMADGLPVVLSTGQMEAALPPDLRALPRLAKPLGEKRAIKMFVEAFDARAGEGMKNPSRGPRNLAG